MPEFHDREGEHQQWKQQVMRREIELEEIDTAQFRDRFGAKSVPPVTLPAKAGTAA
jgi:hypothetical protein